MRTTHEAQCSRWGDEESARRYLLAGGGAPESFDEVWAMELASQARLLADVDAGRRIWGGGFLMYLVSGRKPA